MRSWQLFSAAVIVGAAISVAVYMSRAGGETLATANAAVPQSTPAAKPALPAPIEPKAALTVEEPVAINPQKPIEEEPVAIAAAAPPIVEPKPEPKPAEVDPSDEFFSQGVIPQLKISISNKEEQKLRTDQRRYVECTLIENGETTYRKVGVKLKGAAGSFRGFDDRPALTLHMTKKDDRFHGLDKFHLNNSVQDDSYLCELLASQICREAGCPTPRTTHARVWINNRDLGLYVLKEGFDPGFLKRNFGNGKGNLYDGGFLRDIDQNLEKDEGEGVDDVSDLKALVAACREGDVNKRWAAIAARLDVDAFLNFMALELMMSHWDGYIQNRNNYRVYFRPKDNRAVFMPHGMDQMFADPNFSVFHHPGPIVPNAVMHNLEWKAKYRQRVKELLPLFAPGKLNSKIDAAHARLRPVLAAISEDRAKQHDGRVQDIKNRLAQRAQIIRSQMQSGGPEPLSFNEQGIAKVEDWRPQPEGDTKVEEQEIEGKAVYLMQTGSSNRSNASWRRKVQLAKGKYELRAKAKVTGLTPIEDAKGRGLGLRVSGTNRTNELFGTTDWQSLVEPFEVKEDTREVELVIDMRSAAGSALIEMASIQLAKVP